MGSNVLLYITANNPHIETRTRTMGRSSPPPGNTRGTGTGTAQAQAHTITQTRADRTRVTCPGHQTDARSVDPGFQGLNIGAYMQEETVFGLARSQWPVRSTVCLSRVERERERERERESSVHCRLHRKSKKVETVQSLHALKPGSSAVQSDTLCTHTHCHERTLLRQIDRPC